jgi:hypothetical protein
MSAANRRLQYCESPRGADLIDRLSRDVTMAKPLPPPGMRTAVWMVWAVSYLVVVAVMMFAVMSSAGVVPTRSISCSRVRR